jgi:hypothetical protein
MKQVLVIVNNRDGKNDYIYPSGSTSFITQLHGVDRISGTLENPRTNNSLATSGLNETGISQDHAISQSFRTRLPRRWPVSCRGA